MFVRILLLLTVVPIAELFVLLEVHGALARRYDPQTAILITVGSILATGAFGAALARSQGLSVLAALQRSMIQGQFPARPLLDGVLVLIGAALLLTPGFLTDVFGLSLLVPLTRAFYRERFSSWIRGKIARNEFQVRVVSPKDQQFHEPDAPSNHQVIDVTPESRPRDR